MRISYHQPCTRVQVISLPSKLSRRPKDQRLLTLKLAVDTADSHTGHRSFNVSLLD